FVSAWGGIASLELSLPAVWTEAALRGFGIEDIARWMCARPAALAGLDHCKGAIAPGMDADFVIWDPGKHRDMVYETWLGGEPIDPSAPPRGHILKRPRLATLSEQDF